jgi:hypothetical protein
MADAPRPHNPPRLTRGPRGGTLAAWAPGSWRPAATATSRPCSSIRAAWRPSPASGWSARASPLAEGFARIKAHLAALGRPPAAFAQCELRSPAPFTEAGFAAFNRVYVGVLQEWGIVQGEENPVARSNVCPEIAPPPEPCFHAFSYTVEDPEAPPSFVVAGSGEAREGGASYRESVVAWGDTSPGGMRLKCDYVLGEM